jgi:TPR repeat protein
MIQEPKARQPISNAHNEKRTMRMNSSIVLVSAFAGLLCLGGLFGCRATKEKIAEMKEGPKNTACDLGMDKLNKSIQTDSSVIGSRITNTNDVLKIASDEIATCKADIVHNDKPRLKLYLAITLRAYAGLNRGREDPAKRLAEARTYIQQAADQGYPDAEMMLGSVIENEDKGDPGPKEKEAINWFRRAADQGLVEAQMQVGLEYLTGSVEGTTPDQRTEESIKWYRMAADQGSVAAMGQLGSIYQDKSKFEDAVKWYRKAADQGDSGADASLARLYEKGTGVQQSYQEAFRLLMRSTEEGPGGFDGQIYSNIESEDKEIADAHLLVERSQTEELKNPDRAISDISKAIGMVPDIANFYYRRGAAYFKKGSYSEAKKDCDYALKLVPDYAGALYCRGMVKKATGDSAGGAADIAAAEAKRENLAGTF